MPLVRQVATLQAIARPAPDEVVGLTSFERGVRMRSWTAGAGATVGKGRAAKPLCGAQGARLEACRVAELGRHLRRQGAQGVRSRPGQVGRLEGGAGWRGVGPRHRGRYSCPVSDGIAKSRPAIRQCLDSRTGVGFYPPKVAPDLGIRRPNISAYPEKYNTYTSDRFRHEKYGPGKIGNIKKINS